MTSCAPRGTESQAFSGGRVCILFLKRNLLCHERSGLRRLLRLLRLLSLLQFFSAPLCVGGCSGLGATLGDQRAALGRALHYFNVPMSAVPEAASGGAPSSFGVAFEEASLGELAAAVRRAIAEADAAFDADEADGHGSKEEEQEEQEEQEGEVADGDEGFDWAAWEEEKKAIEALYGNAADVE
jgi:hypothetical protein